MKIALSIDWDYFVPVSSAWDMHFHEDAGISFGDMMWGVRATGAMMQGKDLKEMIKVTTEPWEFLEILEEKNITIADNAQLFIMDSHRFGYESLRKSKYDLVINMDSHHDIFYNNGFNEISCENWLGHLLGEGSVKNVHQIYPSEERRKQDGKPKFGYASLNPKRYKTTCGLGSLPENIELSAIVLCKSGVWTPPWTDKEFTSLMLPLMKMFTDVRAYEFKEFMDYGHTNLIREFTMPEPENLEAMKKLIRHNVGNLV
jgi:hypothetical protein